MRAGELRHRVTIQSPDDAADSAGAPIPNWTELATVWAAVEPLTGREYLAARQLTAEVTHRVRIRYRAGVAPTMRLKFGARYFQIDSVIDVGERREELHLMCREVVE